MNAKRGFVVAGAAVILCGVCGTVFVSFLNNTKQMESSSQSADIEAQARSLGVVQPGRSLRFH